MFGCQWIDQDSASLGDTQLAQRLLDVYHHLERVHAHALALIGEFDGRGLWAADGAVSATQWLTGRAPVSSADARVTVTAARRLRQAPHVAAALNDGRLHAGQATTLAGLRIDRLAEVFDQHEEALVEAAEGLTVDDTRRLARAWHTQADQDGPTPADDDYQTARLAATLGGRGRLEADLAPEGALVVRSALERIMDDLYRADKDAGVAPQPAARRRGDALVEMARRATAAADDAPAARPLIVIRCDLSDLFTRAGWQTGQPAAARLFDNIGGNGEHSNSGGHADGHHHPGDGDRPGDGHHGPNGTCNGDRGTCNGGDHSTCNGGDHSTCNGGDHSTCNGSGLGEYSGDHGASRRASGGDSCDHGGGQDATAPWVAFGRGRFRDGPGGWTWQDCGRPTTDTGQPVDPHLFRQLLCDADLARVITDAPSQVLDAGRVQRTATAAQRRALLIRDGGCVFPGCDRPPGWCHAHHIDWWDHGGSTDLDNLCYLCNHHHRQTHRGAYHIDRHRDGHLSFTRPDGTTIEAPRAAAGRSER